MLLLLACASEPPAEREAHAPAGCWSLRTEDALPSVTQTYDVAVDAPRRRAVATGLGLPYLSVVDLDTAARVDAIAFAERSTTYPRVAVDDAGTAWVASQSAPALVRVDLATRTASAVSDVHDARWVVGLDEGVVVPGGAGVVRVVDGVVAEAAVGARAGARHPDGVVVLGDAEAVVLDADLAEVDRCALPFMANLVAALPDRTLVVADGRRIARGACGGAFEAWTVGVELTDLATDGATVWALDRIGEADPTLGVAWRLDDAPVLAFPTGKNSGYGEVDASGGALWVNAEGTAEVHAYAPDGERIAAVSTGTFVDGLVEVEGALVASGRLSGLLARFDGETVTRGEPVRWPWAPVYDGDAVWMLGQLDGVLSAVDSSTLAAEHRDLDVGANPLLTFGDVAVADDRASVLVAESAADVLFELRDGAQVARWPLGGPPVDDPDFGAHLEVLYRNGVVWLARSFDGRLQRLDLATGARVDATLDPDRLRTLQDRRRTHALAWDGAGPRYGPYGLDPDTLAVVDEWDDVGALLAPWPDGGWLAIDAAGTTLLHLADDGARLGERPWFTVERQPGTLAAPAADGRMAWVNRPYEGVVCRIALNFQD